MPKRQLAGFAGALLLFVGVFAPIVSLPFVGAISYVSIGRGDGILVLLLTVTALIFTARRLYRWLFFVGTLSFAVLAFTMVSFVRLISQLRSETQESLRGNPFASLGEAVVGSVQLQWGWALLIIGAGLLIATAFMAPEPASVSGGGAQRATSAIGPHEHLVGAAVILAGAFVGLLVSGSIGHRTGGMFASRFAPASLQGPVLDERLKADLAAATDSTALERAYLPKMHVTRLMVGESTLGERGVFGEVQNAGTRSLDEVQITIYFLDQQGRTVHEKTYTPVLVSKYGFDQELNVPLRAGYRHKFGVRTDDAPSAWNGQVRVTVTAVKFSR